MVYKGGSIVFVAVCLIVLPVFPSAATYTASHLAFNPDDSVAVFEVLGVDGSDDNACVATLSNDLKLHLPIVTFNGQSYWADFQYTQGLDFLLVDGGQIIDTSPYSTCAPSTLSNDFKLHIPLLIFRAGFYWVDLQYAYDSIFTLIGAGQWVTA